MGEFIMDTNKIFKFSIWILATIIAISLFCSAMTIASTILNIGGFIFGVCWVYITMRTNCFTKITFKKNEKSN
jgi:hypothetical protein